eukprot:1820664-Rhodomonas_salina.1
MQFGALGVLPVIAPSKYLHQKNDWSTSRYIPRILYISAGQAPDGRIGSTYFRAGFCRQPPDLTQHRHLFMPNSPRTRKAADEELVLRVQFLESLSDLLAIDILVVKPRHLNINLNPGRIGAHLELSQDHAPVSALDDVVELRVADVQLGAALRCVLLLSSRVDRLLLLVGDGLRGLLFLMREQHRVAEERALNRSKV